MSSPEHVHPHSSFILVARWSLNLGFYSDGAFRTYSDLWCMMGTFLLLSWLPKSVYMCAKETWRQRRLLSSACVCGAGRGAEGLKLFDPFSDLSGKFLFQSCSNIWSIQQHGFCLEGGEALSWIWVLLSCLLHPSYCGTLAVLALVMGSFFSPPKISYNN